MRPQNLRSHKPLKVSGRLYVSLRRFESPDDLRHPRSHIDGRRVLQVRPHYLHPHGQAVPSLPDGSHGRGKPRQSGEENPEHQALVPPRTLRRQQHPPPKRAGCDRKGKASRKETGTRPGTRSTFSTPTRPFLQGSSRGCYGPEQYAGSRTRPGNLLPPSSPQDEGAWLSQTTTRII